MPLRKVLCTACGLIRTDLDVPEETLRRHYSEGYGLGIQGAAAEPLLYLPSGPAPASAVLMDWIANAAQTAGMSTPKSVLEVGCGAGSLLRRLPQKWPGSSIMGVDIDRVAVSAAVQNGCDVRDGSIESVTGRFDAVIAIAVMEHFKSPREFLRKVADRMTDEGWAAIIVPVQDDGNRDVFFWDHLFHFQSAHVAALIEKANLKLVYQAVDREVHRGYCLSICSKGRSLMPSTIDVRQCESIVRGVVDHWSSIFRRLNEWLIEVAGKGLVVFGVGETYNILQAYTQLRHCRIECGLDDNVARAHAKGLPFPIFAPTPDRFDEAEALIVTFTPSPEAQIALATLMKPVFWVT